MEFYNVKTRRKVEVPEARLRKQRFEAVTSKGIQTRYAVVAEVEGIKLFSFVDEGTYAALAVPESGFRTAGDSTHLT